jgi:rhodanese-related sulfurtransferase
MNSVTVKELLELKDINIIDVREPGEFKTGHVPNAKNIPLSGIIMNHESFLTKGEKYYIICESGGRSSMAINSLQGKGYELVNVIGGTSAYRNM